MLNGDLNAAFSAFLSFSHVSFSGCWDFLFILLARAEVCPLAIYPFDAHTLCPHYAHLLLDMVGDCKGLAITEEHQVGIN